MGHPARPPVEMTESGGSRSRFLAALGMEGKKCKCRSLRDDKQKRLGDGFGDEGFGFGLDLGEVIGAKEGFGVDFVDVFCA